MSSRAERMDGGKTKNCTMASLHQKALQTALFEGNSAKHGDQALQSAAIAEMLYLQGMSLCPQVMNAVPEI
jgi:hypothetical protein